MQARTNTRLSEDFLYSFNIKSDASFGGKLNVNIFIRIDCHTHYDYLLHYR